ncbi:MAG: ABC transporter permease [Planctomycetota bacterium]|nr:ABC transporter permease [Planctomycetota bacterium]
MRLVPWSYNIKSLLVRKSTTALTVISIGATVAVLAGVLSLERGFKTLFTSGGRNDIMIFLRIGATSEGESGLRRDQVRVIQNNLPEIATDESGRPLASPESYLAVRLRKLDGGETNVPIRGVGPRTFDIHGDTFEIVSGRNIRPGSDEVLVGEKLPGRIRNCTIGEEILINTSPFQVVGTFRCPGPYTSEIWGDVERMADALQRIAYQRVIARLRPEVDSKVFADAMAEHPQAPTFVVSEREYLESQTAAISFTLRYLGIFLATIMGIAAVFTSTNTMLSALSSRTHEIGILLSVGFRPIPIFISFLFEAMILGLLGGLVGSLLVLPLSGIETGTTNFQTFTEVAFAFRVTPDVLQTAILFALVLGLLGGALPAWKASRMRPIEALRRT